MVSSKCSNFMEAVYLFTDIVLRNFKKFLVNISYGE